MYFLVSITVTIIYRVVEFLHITGILTKGMKVVENNPFISLKTNKKCINFNSIIYLSINSIQLMILRNLLAQIFNLQTNTNTCTFKTPSSGPPHKLTQNLMTLSNRANHIFSNLVIVRTPSTV